ncbi:MAG: hypothetical protein LBF34_04810 [Puniceicoccales bacterium]|jgi:hypothetical protein|nr:hypothetical protein [Puniceicoccales bacterium]
MVGELVRDIVISLGFMAVFLGASMLFGTASEKKTVASYVAREEVENGKSDSELSTLSH